MTIKMIIRLALVYLLSISTLGAQGDWFLGTFVNYSNTITMRIKSVGGGYQGVLQTNGANFAFEGKRNNNTISGTVYIQTGPTPITASASDFQLTVQAFGYTEIFYKYSPQHELDNYDLTPYLRDFSQPKAISQNQSNQDFDHSYSSHNRGYATEKYQTYPNQNQANNSPYPAHNDPELLRMIQGCQVVFYTSTSILNSNSASSLTYFNYCPDGSFNMSYDGSFSVEGYSGDNAQGASYGRNSGKWFLVNYQGQPAVYLAFNNGKTNVYPVNKQLILRGKWRQGNTQYVVQMNKANCR